MADDLYDHAPCGLLVVTETGEIRRVNRTLCQWLLYETAELKTMTFQQLLTVGAKIFFQTHLSPLLRIQGSIAEVKLEVKRKDGTKIPVMLNAIEKVDSGEVLLHIAIFMATDRHKYEQELLLQRRKAEDLAASQTESQNQLALAQTRLRLALETARLYSWDIDRDTGERRFDESARFLLGPNVPEPLTSQLFVDAIHPDDRAREATALTQALAGDDIYRCTYRLRGLDGQERVVASSGRAFFARDGALTHFVGILQDITQTIKQQAEAQDRALFAEQMVGIVSHDLRNPLAAISMNAQMLALLPQRDKQEFGTRAILRSVDRAQRLINDLLDFTQARLGQNLSVRIAKTNLHKEVTTAVAELSAAFPTHAIEHRSRGAAECHLDIDRIVQAIGNLVANAATHGEPGKPITITTNHDGDHVRISVHNQGQPIPAALLSRLFEPMIRGEDKQSGNKGVGLGLYIVNEIARAHAGSVQVTSSAEAGTTFSIVIRA